MKTQTIFALTSPRSGTTSLAEFLKRNAPQCTVMHEPHPSNRWNPDMFGRVIYDRTTGRFDAVRAALRKKRRAIFWMSTLSRTPTYIEISCAFLMSYWDLAPEFFPRAKVFHLIRNPLEVACSYAHHDDWLTKESNGLHRRIRGLPRADEVDGNYLYYRGRDGHRYKYWTLTGLEPIYSNFDLSHLTLFQRYLIQWIEIENRAMKYLQRFEMHGRCFTLHTPQDLNNPEVAAAILDFVGVDPSRELSLPGVQNATPPGYRTMVGDDELSQCRDVVAALPACYLEIFQHEPYAGRPWVSLLSKS